jgi:hypothetical protein
LILPRADAVLGRWREEHDWTARNGLPTHVSVRVPLPGDADLDPARVVRAAEPLPVTVTLARLENRPGALVAVAEPDAELRRLTARLDVLGDLPPHRDGRADLAYHATIVRTADPDVRRAAAGAIEPLLPLAEQTDELSLFEWLGFEEFRVLWRSSP